jgi:hypothetical protein
MNWVPVKVSRLPARPPPLAGEGGEREAPRTGASGFPFSGSPPQAGERAQEPMRFGKWLYS